MGIIDRGLSATSNPEIKQIDEADIPNAKEVSQQSYIDAQKPDTKTMIDYGFLSTEDKKIEMELPPETTTYQRKQLKKAVEKYDSMVQNVTVNFDYVSALEQGASPKQILDYITKNNPDFDVIGAKKAGASDEQILSHLAGRAKALPEVSKKVRNEIVGYARYSGDSDFLLGLKQASIGVAKASLDFAHLVGTVEDGEYKDKLQHVSKAWEAMDTEVEDKGFFSAHTLGELVPSLATLPVSVEAIGATAILESLSAYAFARQDKDVDESLGWGALGGVTAGAFAILGTHLSGAAMEKAVGKLKKSVLVDKAEHDEFDTFLNEYIKVHEITGRKQRAIAEGQALIAYKVDKLGKGDLIAQGLYHKMWNSQGLLDFMNSQKEERERIVGNLLKLDNPEASIKEVTKTLEEGMELVKSQYRWLTDSYSTVPVSDDSVVNIVKDEVTAWSKLLTEQGLESEEAKLAADSYKRILSAIEDSQGSVGDLLEIEKVINEATRSVKRFTPKQHQLNSMKDLITNTIKKNMTKEQYNNYLNVKRQYSMMAQVRDSKLYNLLDEVTTKSNVGAKTVEAGGYKIDLQHSPHLVDTNKKMDHILEGLGKLDLGKDELQAVKLLLPKDKYVDFEKLLLQHAMVEGTSRVKMQALGKALKNKALITKEGKQLQEAYDIISKFHSYDDILSKLNSRGEYIAESTRSGFGATATATLVRTTVNAMGKIPLVDKLLPSVQQAALVNKFMGKQQPLVKLSKYKGDLPDGIWQRIITKTEAELSAMDWDNVRVEKDITPAIPAEAGLVHSSEYTRRGTQLTTSLGEAIDHSRVTQRLGDREAMDMMDAMYKADQDLLEYRRAISGIRDLKSSELSKKQLWETLSKDVKTPKGKAEILHNLKKYEKAVKGIKPNMATRDKLVSEASAYADLMVSVAKGVQKLVKEKSIEGQTKAMITNISEGRVGLAKGNNIMKKQIVHTRPMSVGEAVEMRRELFNSYMKDNIPKIKEVMEDIPSDKQSIILRELIPKAKTSKPDQLVKEMYKIHKKTGVSLKKLSKIVKEGCKL